PPHSNSARRLSYASARPVCRRRAILDRYPRQIGPLMVVCALSGAFAQEPPPPTYRYEVVSIRAADPNERNSGFGPGAQGGLRARNDTALQLLSFAYDARDYQFIGVPGWARSARYDVNLTPDRPDLLPESAMTRAQLDGWVSRNRQRMQAVLRDRFGLVLRSDTRELPMYVLTIAKGGHKLTAPVNPADAPSFNINGGRQIIAKTSTTKLLADALASLLGHYVRNETGLDGAYDFKLEFAPVSPGPDPAPADASE